MSKVIETLNLLSPSPGTRHELKLHRYGKAGARPKAYIQAALHADEYPGLLVAQHLISQLDELDRREEIEGEIVVVPVANPIGLGQRINDQHLGRYELAGGGNFNRNWPDLTEAVVARVAGYLTQDVAQNAAKIREALEQEVALLEVRKELDDLRKTLLQNSIGADIVLDLHSDAQALPHLYASVHHRELAAELGCDLGARAVLIETEAGGSPFDECNAGVWWKLNERLGHKAPIPLACFSSTIELRGEQDVDDDLASQDASAIVRFLQRRGLIKGDPKALPVALCTPTPLEGTDIVYAPAAGIVVYRKQLGDWVEAGEVIAELIDPMADSAQGARIPMISRTSGLFFAHMSSRLLAPGAAFAKIAGETPLQHREAGNLLEA